MSTYFVTRHQGAIEWAKQQSIKVDKQIKHLDLSVIKKNDIVIGSLPVNLVAEICNRGGRYYHLVLLLPPEWRGKELNAIEMNKFDARVEEYHVQRVYESTTL